jgi:NAD+ kinase
MVFGITGNSTKTQIWSPIRHLIARFVENRLPFVVSSSVAMGLKDLDLDDSVFLTGEDFARSCDAVLSFGGDGTLLNTVHELGADAPPILGVNVGRLGFLANTEVQTIDEAIDHVIAGRHTIDRRAMLHVEERCGNAKVHSWALNEIVLARSGVAGLITIDVDFNDEFLNAYWADGLVIATPTGSTAYSLSAGGPILMPGCGAFVVTPLAAHSLGERPILLPDSGVLKIRIVNVPVNCVYAVDGRSRFIEDPETILVVRRADRDVQLLQLPGQNFADTLRKKLKWGTDKERT